MGRRGLGSKGGRGCGFAAGVTEDVDLLQVIDDDPFLITVVVDIPRRDDGRLNRARVVDLIEFPSQLIPGARPFVKAGIGIKRQQRLFPPIVIRVRDPAKH